MHKVYDQKQVIIIQDTASARVKGQEKVKNDYAYLIRCR